MRYLSTFVLSCGLVLAMMVGAGSVHAQSLTGTSPGSVASSVEGDQQRSVVLRSSAESVAPDRAWQTLAREAGVETRTGDAVSPPSFDFDRSGPAPQDSRSDNDARAWLYIAGGAVVIGAITAVGVLLMGSDTGGGETGSGPAPSPGRPE